MSLKLALAVALLMVAPCSFAKDCKFTVHRHERHVKEFDKKILYDQAHITERSCCVVDHIVPLELGGTNLISNLQLQTKADGKAKDRVENYLAKRVCDGTLDLHEAQTIIKHWKDVRVGE